MLVLAPGADRTLFTASWTGVNPVPFANPAAEPGPAAWPAACHHHCCLSSAHRRVDIVTSTWAQVATLLLHRTGAQDGTHRLHHRVGSCAAAATWGAFREMQVLEDALQAVVRHLQRKRPSMAQSMKQSHSRLCQQSLHANAKQPYRKVLQQNAPRCSP